jgi:hypothetical protein
MEFARVKTIAPNDFQRGAEVNRTGRLVVPSITTLIIILARRASGLRVKNCACRFSHK